MKEQDHPPWWIRVLLHGGQRPQKAGGYPPVSAYSPIRVANRGARSEGALSFHGDLGNNLLVIIFLIHYERGHFMSDEFSQMDHDPLDLLVSIVSKQGSFESYGWIQTVSVRMPGHMACTFDAIAEYSGVSRNKVVVQALEVALNQLMVRLSADDRKRIEEQRSLILGKRVQAITQGVECPEISEV